MGVTDRGAASKLSWAILKNALNWHGSGFEDVFDDGAAGDAVELGFGGKDEPVCNDVRGNVLNGFRCDEVASFKKRECLGHFHQCERGSGACRESDVFNGSSGIAEGDDVVAELLADSDLGNGGLQGCNVVEGDCGFEGVERMAVVL